jgi:hypothetical protein
MASKRRSSNAARETRADAETASTPGFWQRLSGRQKAAAGTIATAFLVAIGGALGTWFMRGAETATQQVLQFGNPPDAPISVRVSEPGTYVSAHVFAPYYIVPEDEVASPEDLPQAEAANEATFFDDAWAQRRSAVAGSPQIVRLEIRAKGDEPITVNAIRANVLARQEPVEGWYVASPGCGVEPVRTAIIDLDQPAPTVQFIDESGSPAPLALSVTRTDIELVELQAASEQSTVDWVAEVFYSGPEGDGSITVSDDGHPFRVSSEQASDGYRFGFVSKTGPPKPQREQSWDANGITAC